MEQQLPAATEDFSGDLTVNQYLLHYFFNLLQRNLKIFKGGACLAHLNDCPAKGWALKLGPSTGRFA